MCVGGDDPRLGRTNALVLAAGKFIQSKTSAISPNRFIKKMEGKNRAPTTEIADSQVKTEVNNYLAHTYGAEAIKDNGKGGKRVRTTGTPPRRSVTFSDDTLADEAPNFSLSHIQGTEMPAGARQEK